MIIDFQHHYTPPSLLKGKKDAVSVGIDERGNAFAGVHRPRLCCCVTALTRASLTMAAWLLTAR